MSVSSTVPMPPGVTMKASDTSTKWCSRVKNVLCSNASVTNAFTSCSNGSSTRMPTDFWLAVRVGELRALVGRLHQPGAAAGDDVAAEPRQFRGKVANGRVDPVGRVDAGRPEDGDPVAIPLRRPQPGQGVDRVPQPEERLGQNVEDGPLVGKRDERRPWWGSTAHSNAPFSPDTLRAC